jgi:NitT/TauT family transport system substrate-binding protein
MLASAGKVLVVIPWSGSGYEGYSQSLVASDKALAERPDVVRRFLTATRKAMPIAADNPALAAESIKAAHPQGDIAVFKAQVEASKPYMINEITEHDGVGVFTPERVRKSWEWVAKANGYSLDKLDPLTVIDPSFAGS